MKILFFGKKAHSSTDKCLDFLSSNNIEVESYIGVRSDRFPEEFMLHDYDWIISFSSPWIIPEIILGKAKNAAINFHPGTPDYPGIGCTNFAIYDEKKEFGVTCHHMINHVDSGEIISVDRFPLLASDTVKSLTDRCYEHMSELFIKVMEEVISTGKLAASSEKWTRKPYTRRELNALCRIDLDMSENEVRKRVRATTFPEYPGAYINLHGIKFIASTENS